MFIPVGTAVTAVEVKDDENCYCDKCFFHYGKGADKVCRENPCSKDDRLDGKNVVYLLVNHER
jgi:hypothetical protein